MKFTEGGIVHRSQIAWSDIKRTAGTGRLIALARSLFHVLVRGHYSELCEVCGRPYDAWRAPTWLFVKLTGSQRGLYCPRCFTKFARDKGFATLMWTPQWWDGELAGRLLDDNKETE